MRTVSRALSALLLVITLTACAHDQAPGSIKTVLLYPPYDYSLVGCPLEPVPPVAKTQEEFGLWTEEVRKAGEECRRQLFGLRSYLQSWESDVDQRDVWTAEGEYK